MISSKKGRQARPNLDEPLPQQVEPAAVEALQRSGAHADQGAQRGQGQTENDRNPEAVNKVGDHIPALVVGAEPMSAPGGDGAGSVKSHLTVE